MNYEHLISFLIVLCIVMAIMTAAALAVATVAVLEARWWKGFALRNELAALDENLPPFVAGLLERYRKFAR